MTSIIAKISEAVNASRSDCDVIIDETIGGDNTGKLFVSGVMDQNALNKWSEVFSAQEEWFNINFVDSYKDEITPDNTRADELHKVTIIYNNNTQSPYLFTPEGWKIFLFNDELACGVDKIHLAFIANEFRNLKFKVSPWLEKPEINPEGEALSDHKKNIVKGLVKYYSPNFIPTSNPAIWILDSLIPQNEIAFEVWKEHSCRELLKCLVNELFKTDVQMVGLSGKPSKKIEFGIIDSSEKNFLSIQTAAKWVYFEGEDFELKHTFITNELARDWAQNATFCEGVKVKLAPALDSARLLYKAHIRSSSKETLKALGDLRKNLAEDMQKIIQQSKDLTSSLWKDVALVISTIVIKYSLDAAKLSEGMKNYAIIFIIIGIYILVSHFISVFINEKFIKILEQNRISWRKKLYGYLDDNDYKELADRPVESAYGNYKSVRNFSSIFILILSIVLFVLGASELCDLNNIINNTLSSILLQLNILAETPFWPQNNI